MQQIADIHDDPFLKQWTVKSERLILSSFTTDIQTKLLILRTIITIKYT